MKLNSSASWFVKLFLIAIIYFLANKIGLMFAFRPENASPIWPPTGIALSAFLIYGYRVWPAITIVAFITDFSYLSGLGFSVPVSIAGSSGLAIGKTLEALVGALLIQKFTESRNPFNRANDTLRFVVFGAVVGPVISATIGVIIFGIMTGNWIRSDMTWLTWWLGDAAGALVITPVIMTWRIRNELKWQPRRIIEAMGLFGSLLIAGILLGNSHIIEYIIIIALILGAFRFGQFVSTCMTFLASAASILVTVQGSGPFFTGSLKESLLFLQGFICLLSVTILLLSSVISERKRSEEALKESEELYRTIVENSSDMIWTIDRDGNFLFFNRRSEEISGYKLDELRGKSFVPLVESKDLPLVMDVFQKTLAGVPQQYEVSFNSKSGKIVTVAANTAPIFSKGMVVATVTLGRDITDRKMSLEFASRRNRQLSILSGAVQKINTVLDIPIVMQNLVTSAIELTDATSGMAGKIIEGKMVFSEYHKNSKMIPINYVFEPGQGTGGQVMKTKSPFISNDAQNDPEVIPEIRNVPGFHNLINVPIIDRKGDVIGCVELHNTKDHRPFDKLDVEMLQGLASSAVTALENARILFDIKKAEEEMLNLSDALDKSLNEIYIFDADTLRFNYVNSGACKNLGYSNETLRSMTPVDIKPEYDEISFRELVDPLLKHEKNKIIFYTIHRRSDGTFYPVEVHVQLIEPGRKFLSMVVDITERHRAEKELRISEEKYRNLYETMAQGVVYQDANGEIISVNPAAEKILGLSSSKLIGRTSISPGWKAIHEDGSNFPGEVHPAMLALRTRKEVRDVVIGVFSPREKQYKWIIVHAVPQFRYGETKPYQAFTTFEDITKIKQAEEAIHEANWELMTINQVITGTTGILDLTHILETVLDESMKIVGFEGGSIFLTSPEDTLELAVHRGLSEAMVRNLNEQTMKIGEGLCGESAREMKPLILADQESVKKMDIRASKENIRYHAAFPIVTSGKCAGVLCLFTRTDKKLADKNLKFLETITAQVALSIENARLYKERKEYIEKLEKKVSERTAQIQENQTALVNLVDDMNRAAAELGKANKRLLELDLMKSMFIASTSHELRTPLNSIIGFTSILLEGWSGELTPEQRDHVQIVNTSGKHLLSLINDIIDISKIEGGRLEVYIARFKLKEVIDEAVSILKIEISGKGLLLKVEVEDVEINTDRKRLLQCMMNLLSNAVKFTEMGEINIIAKVINKEIEISVTDTGIGIKKEDIPKLFTAFVRLESPLTTKTSGTGLGLYLTQKLTKEVLRGEISVESEYGNGSKFTLRIPREVEI